MKRAHGRCSPDRGVIWMPLPEKMGKELPGGAAAFRKLLDSKYPAGHAGGPNDIGWGIVYLATDESKFVTDTELIIGGGYTAQ
jgi:3(or 17)beta-hydroxysteroid dehydrogenase